MYDIPGHSEVTLYRNSAAITFPLPYPADLPLSYLLAKHPLVQVIPDPVPAAPLADAEAFPAKPQKPSRKEV